MQSIFTPDSIAVIGASTDLNRIPGLPIKYLLKHEYEGEIYPINPNHKEVSGLKCYPSVSDLPQTPDLALVIVPAEFVLGVVEEALEMGVKSILVVSSGFSETGLEENERAERRLATLGDEYNANIIGPNSQGIINAKTNTTASFTPALKRDSLIEGDVSFVTQSGAFGGALTTMLQENNIGMNRWVATGNEAHLESLDFFKAFVEDDSTDVVAGYIEGFVDGRKLVELRRTNRGIDLPIVLLKVGRSDRGKAAAASHTGKIAGSAKVYDGVFTETGVIAVDDIDRFIDIVEALSTIETLPGSRLGVITTSGGAGAYIADLAAEVGIELPEIDGETYERIEKHIPAYGSTVNPIDVTAQVQGNPQIFQECLRALMEDEDIDTVLLQITNVDGELAQDFANTVTEATATSETSLIVSWTGGLEKEKLTKIYQEANIPVFENPRAAIETIAAIDNYRKSKSPLREALELPSRPPEPSDDGPTIMDEVEAKALLSKYGLSVPEEQVASTAKMAVEAANEIGYPVVAKLISSDIQHRDKVGGIQTNLESPQAVTEAFNEISAVGRDRGATVEGVAIQQQITSGTELSLGIAIDETFGPVVMFGRGGVDIESVEDITFRSIPTARSQAGSMIEDLETLDENIFDRNEREELTEAIVGLSDIYCDNPWIQEADINPIIVGPDGVIAVDALFIGSE